MPSGYDKFEVDREAVRQHMVEAKDLGEFKRFQCIHLRVNEGLTVGRTSGMEGLAKSTIHNLHNLCRQKGLEALKMKGRGGRRRSFLSLKEEKTLPEGIFPEATHGLLEVGIVHRAFENKVGHSVARYSVYRFFTVIIGGRFLRALTILKRIQKHKKLLKNRQGSLSRQNSKLKK